MIRLIKQVIQHSQRYLDEESADDYRPRDPSIIVERVQTLEDAYVEYVLKEDPDSKNRTFSSSSTGIWERKKIGSEECNRFLFK